MQNERLVFVENLMMDRCVDGCFHAAFVLHMSMLTVSPGNHACGDQKFRAWDSATPILADPLH